jgi:cyanophycinase
VSTEPRLRLALVGSGEYLEEIAPLEARLIGSGQRYVEIPLAAGLEGEERFEYWVQLGSAQAARLGVRAVTVPARTRQDALDPQRARLVDGADLVYLSGGNPTHLAASLRGTPLWRAVVDAVADGASLARCSAGAMALGGAIASLRTPGERAAAGLGLPTGGRDLPPLRPRSALVQPPTRPDRQGAHHHRHR